MSGMLCIKSPSDLNNLVDAIFHAFILGLILTIFYFFFASKIASDAFKSEIKNAINRNIAPIIGNIPAFRNNVRRSDLETAKKLYEKENDTTVIQNRWVKKYTYTVLLLVLLTVLLLAYILSRFCEKVPLKKILVENIALFAIVGTVEVLFFLKIATSYIPIKPSTVTNNFIDALADAL